MGLHFLLQGIFPTHVSYMCEWHLIQLCPNSGKAMRSFSPTVNPSPTDISRPKDNPALHLADSGHSCDPSMSVVNEWAGPLEVDLFMDGSESFRGRTHPKGQQSWTLKFSSVTKLPLLSKAHGLWGLFLCFILQSGVPGTWVNTRLGVRTRYRLQAEKKIL